MYFQSVKLILILSQQTSDYLKKWKVQYSPLLCIVWGLIKYFTEKPM